MKKRNNIFLFISMFVLSITCLTFGVYSLSKYYFNASGTITYENTAATMMDVACTISGSSNDRTVYATSFVGNSSRPNYNTSSGNGYQLASNVQKLTSDSTTINLGTIAFGTDSSKIRLTFNTTNYNEKKQYSTKFSLPTISAYYTEYGISYINTYSQTNDSTGETVLDIVKKDSTSFSNVNVSIDITKLDTNFVIDTSSTTSATNQAPSYTTYNLTESNQLATSGTITFNDLVFTLSDDGTNKTATVKQANNNITSAVIPNSIAGYKVSGGSSSPFNSCAKLTTVVVPVDFVYEDAMFYNCVSILNIKCISETTEGLFYNGELILSSNPTSEWWYSSGKRGLLNLLKEITFASNTTEIGDSVFSYMGKSWVSYPSCKLLKSISIPSTVLKIGKYAFYESMITEITIPSGITTINDQAFYNCNYVTSLTFNATNCSVTKGAFAGLGKQGNGASVVFGDNVETMPENYMFLSMNAAETTINAQSKITSIKIGNKIQSIPDKAFMSTCDNLTSLTIGANVQTIGADAFSGASKLNTVIIPNAVATIGEDAFLACGATTITIGTGVTSIGANAFKNCKNVTTFNYNATNCTSTFGTTLNAFDNMGTSGTGITLTIGDNVKSIRSKFMQNTNMPKIIALNIGSGIQTISGSAFSGCVNLQEINIPNTVKSIGTGAFSDCTGAKTLSLGSGVQTITASAFENCSGLIEITIPDNVIMIYQNAFANCTGAKTITIGNGIRAIQTYAFSGCTGLEILTIGSAVTTIGKDAFANLSKLKTLNYNAQNCNDLTESTLAFTNIGTNSAGTTINIGDYVSTIPANMFNNAGTGIKTINIGSGLASVTKIGKYAFANLTGVTTIKYMAECCNSLNSTDEPFKNVGTEVSITIGKNETGIDPYISIPDYLFYTSNNSLNCTNLTINNDIATIGTKAFANLAKCTSVTYNAPNLIKGSTYGDKVFEGLGSGNTSGGEFTIGDSVIEIPEKFLYEEGNYVSPNIEYLEIGSNVEKIHNSAFNNLKKLSMIGYGAKNAQMDHLTHPNEYSYESWESVDWGAFRNCGTEISTGITTCYITSGVETIPDYLFDDYTGTDDVGYENYRCKIGTLACQSDKLKSIGKSSFQGTGLTSFDWDNLLTAPDNNITIGDYAFSGTQLTSFDFSGFTTIGKYAFSDCKALETITLTGVTSIGTYAFYSCSKLTSISVPNSVTTLGTNAFSGCSGATTISIGTGITNIPNFAFSTCNKVTTLSIPSNIKTIGISAFSYCIELTNLTLVSGLTTIYGNAFYNCRKLTSLTIPSTVTNLQGSAFIGANVLNSVSVASGNTTYTSSGNCIIQKSNNRLIVGSNNSIIPPRVKTIGSYAFSGRIGLSSISLPSALTNILENAFDGCTSLTRVEIPDTVTDLANNAFQNCTGLGYVKLSSTLKTIGSSVFNGCSSLASISIPATVTRIGSSAFSGCQKLRSVYISSATIAKNITGANSMGYLVRFLITGDRVCVLSTITTIGRYLTNSSNFTSSTSGSWKVYTKV